MLRSGLRSAARAQRLTLGRASAPSPLLARPGARLGDLAPLSTSTLNAGSSRFVVDRFAERRTASSASLTPAPWTLSTSNALYRDAYFAVMPTYRVSTRSFSSVPTSGPSTTSGSSATPASPITSAEAAAMKKKIAAARRRRSKIRAQEQRLETALEKGGERRLIRMDSLDKDLPKVSERAVSLLKRTPQMTIDGLKAVVRGLAMIYSDPAQVKAWLGKMKGKVKEELDHYWLGTKLLYADMTTSTRILRRLLHGNALSRRERKQLQRTVADLLRLVPFAFFVVVPFMELLLPVALKVFPNMLPSTYKDSFQREEDMKRQLQLRVSLAEFLQDTVKEIMEDTRATEGVTEERKATAKDVMHFVERAQRGEPITAEETLQMATLFNDELMLDNISRPQLVAMCRYMGVQHYGNENLLRFQLRNRIRQLKKDDQDIIWEGLDSLDKDELQQACLERGMRATGLTKAGYVRQMRQWLDLSINKNVPASLLIMSRALNITAMDNVEAALATSMSSMDEEVVTEVALATSSKEETSEMRKLKLESIRYQNEMIADEEKFREEGQKKKAETEAAEAAAAAATTEPVAEEQKAEVFATGEKVKETTPTPTPAAATTPAVSAEPLTIAEAIPAPKLIENIISLEELSALEALAFKSIVEKERQVVDQLKQNKYDMDVEGLLAAGRIGAQSRENKTAGRMMKRLESMLSRLEVQLDEVDRHVGDKLNVLDLDSDGVVSAEELRDAVMTILRKTISQEDVEWVISRIDEDNDGKILLEELVAWTAKARDILEATGQMSLETTETPAEPETTPKAAPKAAVKRSASRKN